MFLTPEQWLLVQPLLPSRSASRGRPARDLRPILEGILHKLATRTSWTIIPNHYASWQTCYQHYLLWKEDGTLREVIVALLEDLSRRGQFDLQQVFLQGHVTMEKHGRRIRLYYSAALPWSWQLRTALLYYQLGAARLELKQGLVSHPDPLVEVFAVDPPFSARGDCFPPFEP